MGLFLSFLGGAAEQFTETLKESEKTAKAEAALRTKALYKNYGEVVKNNRKLESELKADAAFLQTLSPNISQDQVSALVFNRPVMAMLKKKVEAGEVNPKELDFATLTGITEQNENPIAASERIESMFKLPKATAEVETAMPKGFFENVSARQQKAAETQMTAALGVSMEELRGAKEFRVATPDVGAKFDLTQLMKPKKMEDEVNKAELALLNARRENDPAKIAVAEADMKQIDLVKNRFTSDQAKFANKVADIKNRFMFGTPEQRAAAKPEYDKLMQDLRNEAKAKQIDEKKEGSIPSLSTLNAFASNEAAKAVARKYGDKIGKGIALIDKGDGSTEMRLTIADPALRSEVEATRVAAVREALSVYTDDKGRPLSRDVEAILRQNPMPTGTTPPPAMTPAQINQARSDADKAITQGADRASVAKRFKDLTGQEL